MLWSFSQCRYSHFERGLISGLEQAERARENTLLLRAYKLNSLDVVQFCKEAHDRLIFSTAAQWHCTSCPLKLLEDRAAASSPPSCPDQNSYCLSLPIINILRLGILMPNAGT
jgi:hypothetical protein